MHVEITPQKYVVNVYSDQSPINNEPLRKLVDYDELPLAVQACKNIVDTFLENPELGALHSIPNSSLP